MHIHPKDDSPDWTLPSPIRKKEGSPLQHPVSTLRGPAEKLETGRGPQRPAPHRSPGGHGAGQPSRQASAHGRAEASLPPAAAPGLPKAAAAPADAGPGADERLPRKVLSLRGGNVIGRVPTRPPHPYPRGAGKPAQTPKTFGGSRWRMQSWGLHPGRRGPGGLHTSAFGKEGGSPLSQQLGLQGTGCTGPEVQGAGALAGATPESGPVPPPRPGLAGGLSLRWPLASSCCPEAGALRMCFCSSSEDLGVCTMGSLWAELG